MKKDLKNVLKDAFEAPEPLKKKAFVKKFPLPRISTVEFMLIQAAYIRIWFWLLSIFVFVIAVVGACFLKRDMLWIISSLLPFAALVAVTENIRSVTYNMEEMEMASRFSLKSVVLARMGVIGGVHLLLLCFLIPLGNMYSAMTLLETGVFMLVPYLASTVLGLWITRKLRGREAIYGCTGFAVIISGINFLLSNMVFPFHYYEYFRKCSVALIVLVIWAIWEYKQSIQRTEELTWSLS